MGTETRGFVSMSSEKARKAQSKGGCIAQASGKAHTFTQPRKNRLSRLR